MTWVDVSKEWTQLKKDALAIRNHRKNSASSTPLSDKDFEVLARVADWVWCQALGRKYKFEIMEGLGTGGVDKDGTALRAAAHYRDPYLRERVAGVCWKHGVKRFVLVAVDVASKRARLEWCVTSKAFKETCPEPIKLLADGPLDYVMKRGQVGDNDILAETIEKLREKPVTKAKEETKTDKGLHIDYRPDRFKDVVGQDAVVASLYAKAKNGKLPHVMLFTGPSGTGKTTLARILRRPLKCSTHDFAELNAAKDRGIDMVRDISSRTTTKPLAGDNKIYVIDEAHALTSDAQSSLLKMLEDTPDWVYYILATTNPEKLKATIKTRCTEFKLKSLQNADVLKVLNSVIERSGIDGPSDEVIEKIISVADGSARKAVVLLGQVIDEDGDEAQIKAIAAADFKTEAIDLARALMKKAKWNTIRNIIKNMGRDLESVEGVRRAVLGYCASCAIKGDTGRAMVIMDSFRDHFYDSGIAGLVLASWESIND